MVSPALWGENELPLMKMPVTIIKSCAGLLVSIFFSVAVVFASRAEGHGADLTQVRQIGQHFLGNTTT
jgi:hypothetical protein